MAKTTSKTRAGKGSAGVRKPGAKSEPQSQPQPQRELRGDELDRVSGGVPENTIGGAHRT